MKKIPIHSDANVSVPLRRGGHLELSPGRNSVREDDWREALEHVAVRAKVEGNSIRLLDVPAKLDVRELESMSLDEVWKRLGAVTDLEQLYDLQDTIDRENLPFAVLGLVGGRAQQLRYGEHVAREREARDAMAARAASGSVHPGDWPAGNVNASPGANGAPTDGSAG